MFKKIIFLLVTFVLTFGFIRTVLAVNDGIYIGAFKMTYGHGYSSSKKGDTGVFTFDVKSNKVIKITTPDVEGWNRNAIRYFFKINPETGELDGYCSVSDSNGSTYDVKMEGLFIKNKFAGEGKVIGTYPESVLLNKFIFENID